MTAIGAFAFTNRADITSVEIGDAAFTNRTDIATVVVPDTVMRIGHSAFLGSVNLHEAYFGTNVQEIGSSIFAATRTQLVTNMTFAGAAPRLCETLGLDTNSTVYITSAWSTNKVETWQGCKVILIPDNAE